MGIGDALSIFGAGFGAWAAVVYWGVRQVVKRIDDIASSVKQVDDELRIWINHTEHRLTAVEKDVTHIQHASGMKP